LNENTNGPPTNVRWLPSKTRTSCLVVPKDAGTAVRQEGSKWVEGNGNLQKKQKIVTNYACFCQTTML